MKATYTPLEKTPVTLKMTIEDLVTIRFCISGRIGQEESKARFADSMAKHDPAYKKIAKSNRREARRLEKLYKDLKVNV